MKKGLSRTILPNGQSVTLTSLIKSDYEAFLGEKYAKEKDVRVSARVEILP